MPDDRVGRDDDAPKIDLSGAIGEGGHEVEQLGYEGVPDTGSALRDPEESQNDEEIEIKIDRVANEASLD